VEIRGKKLIRVEDDGMAWTRRTRGSRLSNGTRRARSRGRTTWERFERSDSAAEALAQYRLGLHFTLRTRPEARRARYRIKVNAGCRRFRPRGVGRPEGTCIEVATCSTTCRRGASSSSPMPRRLTQVSRLTTQLALGYPEAGFTLTSGGRPCCSVPRRRTCGKRFFQLFGDRPEPRRREKGSWRPRDRRIRGRAGDQGPVRGAQNVFVNRRIVKDRTIAHAISEAYSVATIQERSPRSISFSHRAGARRRQRASHEGRGPVSRAVAGARGAAARARRRARTGASRSFTSRPSNPCHSSRVP
jgi:hypothetical protein